MARGEADVYPRFGPTMEWDTAAGHAVLAAAGGSVVDAEGHPLRYGKTDDGPAQSELHRLGLSAGGLRPERDAGERPCMIANVRRPAV